VYGQQQKEKKGGVATTLWVDPSWFEGVID